jgi:hypothetical protein
VNLIPKSCAAIPIFASSQVIQEGDGQHINAKKTVLCRGDTLTWKSIK